MVVEEEMIHVVDTTLIAEKKDRQNQELVKKDLVESQERLIINT